MTSAVAAAPWDIPWLILPGFITEEERLHLLCSALQQRRSGALQANPAGPQRFYRKLDETNGVDSLLEVLTTRLEDSVVGLSGKPKDLVLGRVCSFIEAGGHIHDHRDAYNFGSGFEGRGHLRANLVVQMDPACCPIIEGRRVEVAEGDAWVFLASHSRHGTAPVRGPQPRIVFGFGWTVPADFPLVATSV